MGNASVLLVRHGVVPDAEVSFSAMQVGPAIWKSKPTLLAHCAWACAVAKIEPIKPRPTSR